MKALAFGIALLAPTTACAQSFSDWSGWTISWSARRAVIAGVSKTMRDASSAQLRNVRPSVIAPDTVMCGEINSKNALGLYLGFKPFIMQMKDKDIVLYTDEIKPIFAKHGCI